MAYKKASKKIFIEGTIQTVAKIGIENTRTKDVADYAGYSEATMFRTFPTKEVLLRETFLHIDKQVSDILTQSTYFRNPDGTPFELAAYAIWHNVYRYLIDNREKTIFLIRYRYSSLYTNEVHKMRQAYNGGFDRVYAVLEKKLGNDADTNVEFLVNYIFEMTLGFVEKIITEKIKDDQTAEYRSWIAVNSTVKSWTLAKMVT